MSYYHRPHLTQAEITANAAEFRREFGDPRAFKRFWRKRPDGDPTYTAYCEGQRATGVYLDLCETLAPRERRNPYPPGRRHDAWNQGFASCQDEEPREARRYA